MMSEENITQDGREAKKDSVRASLQKIFLYAGVLYPLSAFLLIILYEPMVLLAIWINGSSGAFWGAFYYVYSILGYYAIMLFVIMREYVRYYAVQKNKLTQKRVEDRRRRTVMRTVAANPSVLEFLFGLVLLIIPMLGWGCGVGFVSTTIPMSGAENFLGWVGFNLLNIVLIFTWFFFVLLMYMDYLKHNDLEIR